MEPPQSAQIHSSGTLSYAARGTCPRLRLRGERCAAPPLKEPPIALMGWDVSLELDGVRVRESINRLNALQNRLWNLRNLWQIHSSGTLSYAARGTCPRLCVRGERCAAPPLKEPPIALMGWDVSLELDGVRVRESINRLNAFQNRLWNLRNLGRSIHQARFFTRRAAHVRACA